MGCSNSSVIDVVKKTETENENDANASEKNKHITGNFKRNKKRTPTSTKDITIEQSNVFKKSQNDVKNDYQFIDIIDRGAYGTYYKVLHIKLNQYRMAKVVSKSIIHYKTGEKTFNQEIEILTSLDHPNINKLFDYYEDDDFYYLIFELIKGGLLYDQIIKYKTFNEINAAFIIKQLFSVLNYLHSYDIVHRDIRPEIIKFESDVPGEFFIKLIDFGSAIFGEISNDLNLIEPSPYYQAPEISENIITKKCDLWSCGVILYTCLCGYPPFKGNSKCEVKYNASKGNYNFDSIEWDNISTLAKDLVKQLLNIDYNKRISSNEALEHPWIKKMISKKEKNEPEEKITITAFNNLKNFTALQKLQQASIAYLVHQMSASEQFSGLRNVFRKLDKTGDGRLTVNEIIEGFNKYFKKTDISHMKELEDTLNNIDQDKNGYIEYEEFLRATVKLDILLTENNLNLAFDYFDIDKKGFLSQNNIIESLGLAIDDVNGKVENELVKEIIKEVDYSGDGKISLDEFKTLMKKVLIKV